MSSFLSQYGRTIMLCTVVAASSAGALYLLNQFLRKKRPNVDELIRLERRRRVEKLVELRDKLEQLLGSLDNFEPETPDTEDDECIVCNSAKAIIQTYPCKHRVLCRRCFVKTLQVAVNDLNLPLKCVVCRTRIHTLDRDRHEENLSDGAL